MSLNTTAALLIIILSSATHAADKSDYLNFFEKYQALGNSFDPAIGDLYSDEAKITAIRKMPDGIEQTLKIEGGKWKQILVDSMELGKKRGDKSEFSKINISVETNRAKITANRYATVKCFNDSSYYMIIENTAHNELRIVEEFMESPLQSTCANTPKNDIALVLQASAKMINKQLPLMVDSDTKLEKISAEGKTLIYHYVLVNFLSSELDAEALESNLKPATIQQTCTMSNMKPIIDQGGTVSYRYNGKDQKQVLEINIDKRSCYSVIEHK